MLSARKFRWLILGVLIVLGGLVGARMGGGVRAAPGKSPLQDTVVISEFRTRGPSGAYDEFIEIFNPSGATIDIGNWQILKVAGCPANTKTELATIPSGTVLQPGQHYLIVRSVSAGTPTPALVVTADKYFPDVGTPDSAIYGIADNGGIALFNNLGQMVDQVGMCYPSDYLEGTPLNPMGADLDQSYERKPGGATGSCYDSDNNAFDFILISPGDPQNLLSSYTICAAATDTPTYTPTNTATPTPTITVTPTVTDTPTPTSTPSSTSTPTSTGTPTNTPTPTGSATVTPTATPTAPSHLVISELRSRGPNGVDDEFVELYNPSGAPVNMGGWMVKKSSSCSTSSGTSVTNLVTIPNNTILLPGQHYLVAATGSSITGADQTYPASLSDDGGVALVTFSGTVVDEAGMSAGTLYIEGTPLAKLVDDINQSYERKPGGSTSCYDTNNNVTDFSLISPSNPHNKASPIVMCAGVLTSTPSFTPSRTPTRSPTRAPTTIPGVVVINEFLPHPHTDWNGDGTANTSDEYIELMNMGTDPVNIKNWKLDNGIGTTAYPLPDMTLLPRQIALFYRSESGIPLNDGGSSVRLLKSDGHTADIYNYPAVPAADATWCRLPDGTGVWAFACRPTPGKPNLLMPSAPGSAPGGEGPESAPICLKDPIPQAFMSAECNSPGTRMWGETGEEEIWLARRWKFDVFLK